MFKPVLAAAIFATTLMVLPTYAATSNAVDSNVAKVVPTEQIIKTTAAGLLSAADQSARTATYSSYFGTYGNDAALGLMESVKAQGTPEQAKVILEEILAYLANQEGNANLIQQLTDANSGLLALGSGGIQPAGGPNDGEEFGTDNGTDTTLENSTELSGNQPK